MHNPSTAAGAYVHTLHTAVARYGRDDMPGSDSPSVGLRHDRSMGLTGRSSRAHDDAAHRALDYPGRLASRPALLGGDGGEDARRVQTAVGRGGRTPVVALGSNGCLPVLRAKLLGSGCTGVVPLFPVLVSGLIVAHSAHVSRGGYVAATPVVRRTGAARGVLAWFDDEQLAVMDASEPNYVRHAVSTADYPLTVVHGPAPERFWVYRSVWGALVLHGHPVRLSTQRRLHRALADDPALAARLPLHDPVATVQRLRGTTTQLWIREYWARVGASCGDGLLVDARR